MPTKRYSFPGLIADGAGTVSGSTTDSVPLFDVSLDRVVVRSLTGCNGRNHVASANLTGGVTFNFSGPMTDCQDLEVALGGLNLSAFAPVTITFQVRGYNPGEVVDLEGVLVASFASPFFAADARPRSGVATVLQGVSKMVGAPVGAFTNMVGELVQEMPIVGKNGMFATMRKDFLQMSNAMTSLANELRRSNDARGK
jgi:hypothetical protein